MEWLLSDPSPPLPTTTGIPALSGGTLTSPLFTVPEEPPEVVDTWSKTVSTAMWRQNERPLEPSGQGTSSAAYLVDAQRRYVWQKGDAEASVCVCVCVRVCVGGGGGAAPRTPPAALLPPPAPPPTTTAKTVPVACAPPTVRLSGSQAGNQMHDSLTCVKEPVLSNTVLWQL